MCVKKGNWKRMRDKVLLSTNNGFERAELGERLRKDFFLVPQLIFVEDPNAFLKPVAQRKWKKSSRQNNYKVRTIRIDAEKELDNN